MECQNVIYAVLVILILMLAYYYVYCLPPCPITDLSKHCCWKRPLLAMKHKWICQKNETESVESNLPVSDVAADDSTTPPAVVETMMSPMPVHSPPPVESIINKITREASVEQKLDSTDQVMDTLAAMEKELFTPNSMTTDQQIN